MRTKEEILQGENEKLFLIKCSMNFALFCERVLGYDMKPFHKEWCEIMRKHNRVVIAAPTGYGKTLIFGIAYPLWLSYFRPGSKSLIISKTTKGQSSTVVEEIKLRIENNEILKELLPSDKRMQSWTKENMICSNDSRIFNAPYNTSIRGRHVDYIFGDEIAVYPDRQNNYTIWFRDVLSRVADSKHGKVAAVSTPMDAGDLLTVLMRKDKGYFAKEYPAIVDENGNKKEYPYEGGISIWKERFPMKKLMDILREQGEEQFERNYQCNRNAPVYKSIFSIKKLTAGYDDHRKFSKESEGGLVMIGADFALSEDPRADEDAYVVVEKIGGMIIIKHMETHRGLPTEMKIKRLEQLYYEHQPYQIICDESNVGGHVTQQLLMKGVPAVAHPFGPKSRNQLLSVLSIVSNNEKLIIPYSSEDPKCMDIADKLVQQLIGFREERSEKTGSTLIASTSPHDDLAAALSLAVKSAQEQEIDAEGFASGS